MRKLVLQFFPQPARRAQQRLWAFVAVGTFGNGQEYASPERTVTGPGTSKPARTARRCSPAIRRDLECAPREEQVRPGAEVGYSCERAEGAGVSQLQPLSRSAAVTATALRRRRDPAGAMETAHALGVVLPVMTVATAHTIGLQELQTTPLALETAVTMTTVYSVYIIHRL